MQYLRLFLERCQNTWKIFQERESVHHISAGGSDSFNMMNDFKDSTDIFFIACFDCFAVSDTEDQCVRNVFRSRGELRGDHGGVFWIQEIASVGKK